MATRPGEVFHTDIGVLPIASFSGYRYFIVFVDEYTRYVFTFLMRKRDEVYHVYEDLRRKVRYKIKYIYTVVSEYDDEIKRVQSDNGKEYEKLARIIVKYGTRFRFTQAYTPQQNGMAERRIRMVMEKALCLLFEGHLSGALWGEAVMTSTYLINLTPSAAIDMRSPYLLWHNCLPRINKLRTFGCAAYAWIPRDKRTKLEAHAVKCIFVGYDEEDRSGYMLLRLLDCEVIHSRDVKFNEDEFPRLADRVLSALPDERQRTCGCHHCDDSLAQATASVEAILRAEDAATKARTRRQGKQTGEVDSTSSGTEPIDTQSTSAAREIRASEAQLTRTQGAPLPRTSEAFGASEASGAWSGQQTSASSLKQPTQAGSAQVSETLLPRVIESGDDRMVDPQRAVSPRSGGNLRTRTDHPSTWSVDAQPSGTTIGGSSDAQSRHEWHPGSVDASRSQADVQRQPTLSRQARLQANPIDPTQPHGLPVLDERAVEWFQQFIAEEVNKRLHQDKDSGHMSFLFCERASGEPSLIPSYKCNHQKPSQHCVCCRLRQDAVYATSMGDGVGQCETLCRECTGRQDIVASKVARTVESGGHNRAYPGRQGTVLEQTSLAVCDQTKVSGRQRCKRRRADRLLNEQALVDAQRDSDQVKRRGRSCMCCYEDEGAVALLARAGVSALDVEPTCALPSEEDAVLDYLRTSGIETKQDPVTSDKDLPSYEQFVYALLAIKYVNEPQTYKQAIASGEAAQWGKAMDCEIHSHEENATWVLVPRPRGRNILKNRWVYVIKYKPDGSVDRFKARLVIKGFLQKYGIDYTEIFAPVVRMEILRQLLALAAAMDWEVEQMDVKTAFLNGFLEEEIYMEQPVGFVQPGKEDHVCVLKKSLYGLKQAPRVWYYTFYEAMMAEGFVRLIKDHCVFIKTRGKEICIFSVYVDDLLVIGSKAFVSEMKDILKRRFQMTDLGGVSYLLGWHIERRRSERIIFVHQEKYATKVLDRFGLAQCRPVRSPEETSQKLSESDCPQTDAEKQDMEKFPYREAVGSFMYLMMGTRPDLANFVRQVSRYLQNPAPPPLELRPSLAHALSAYSDADYANSVDTRRSVSGYVTYLFGNSPISWRSSLPKLVTLSTTEAEYVALASTVQEVLYLKQVMLELGYDQVGPVKIGEDNQSTIRISKNPEHHGRCKHIDIRFFFVQERQHAQDIDV
ncbi:Retrovirus-related Pol polyprotein from transposon TNT 1-94, partial [Phytophthora rubi]